MPRTREALLGAKALPDMIKRVGIGTRVRMVFTQVSEGFAIPQWTINEDTPQPFGVTRKNKQGRIDHRVGR